MQNNSGMQLKSRASPSQTNNALMNETMPLCKHAGVTGSYEWEGENRSDLQPETQSMANWWQTHKEAKYNKSPLWKPLLETEGDEEWNKNSKWKQHDARIQRSAGIAQPIEDCTKKTHIRKQTERNIEKTSIRRVLRKRSALKKPWTERPELQRRSNIRWPLRKTMPMIEKTLWSLWKTEDLENEEKRKGTTHLLFLFSMIWNVDFVRLSELSC